MEENKISVNGFGIASLVTGILSIVFIQFIVISIIFGVFAIAFGIIGLKKPNRTLAKSGLIIGIASLVLTFVLFLFLEVLDVSLFTIPSWYKNW